LPITVRSSKSDRPSFGGGGVGVGAEAVDVWLVDDGNGDVCVCSLLVVTLLTVSSLLLGLLLVEVEDVPVTLELAEQPAVKLSKIVSDMFTKVIRKLFVNTDVLQQLLQVARCKMPCFSMASDRVQNKKSKPMDKYVHSKYRM
jgi:hypothetical protein